ncbi:MAG: polysaccharide lyase family protein [Planctomycetota bacterium]
MKNSRLIKSVILMLLFSMCLTALAAGETKLLWQIGKADNNTAEFALGPDRSNLYSVTFPRDALFIAGQSDSKRDWPYIQPGPADTWAGSKSHTFAILFGIKTAPTAGQCELVLDFVDTHSSRPPKMQIKINDATFVRDLPRGAGDDSAFGQPEKGREHRLTIDFPAHAIKAGTNTITITSLTGSWILYDYVALRTPVGVEAGPLKATNKLLDVHTQPFLVEHTDGKLYQPVMASVLHIGEPVQAAVAVNGSKPVKQLLKSGYKVIEGLAPMVTKPTSVEVDIKVAGQSIGKQTVTIKPVRKWEVYLLHHSHVDIGYTHVQTDVVRKHWQYFEQVIELARKTADYPAGSRFKWNVEVLWAVDSYLKQASKQKRQQFIEAIKKGWIGLDALYGNELTALCRPEELIRLVGYAERLRRRYDFTINSAMITDVPGYTWGIVPVLAQSGVKYFSVGPNRGHRIGYTLSSWGDKPFYWESPSGKRNILCWVAGEGYSLFHSGRLDSGRLFNYLKRLENSKYPYDMVQVRYSIGGDNGPPDPGLSDFVKNWNAKYAYPKLVVATTGEMFREFERRYGSRLPKARGDFTPYWEDGAGSSARETSMNRAAAERLVQSETLWAMLNPAKYPAEDFDTAWRNVILYDEHTWGAHCSISQPDSDFTKAQWKIKQAFALDADAQSEKLLNASLAKHRSSSKKVKAVDVFNTCSWPRTDLVVLPKDWNLAGDMVKDADDKPVLSQRLSTGELVFVAEDVPSLGAERFTFGVYPTRTPIIRESAKAHGIQVFNAQITVSVDENTGAIASFKRGGISCDFVHGKDGLGLNDYFYVAGRNPKEPQRNGPVKISVKEHGPIVASLLIESDAPGCNKLTREARLIAGLDRVDIINVIDKQKIYKQEAVHLAFPFNVPEGVMRMDTPWAVVRPEEDQLSGACKNYFTVQRWVDVSNSDYGITWATVDAPLIEVGAITNDPRGGVGWIKKLEPKAGQQGPTTFRYSIKPHTSFDSGAAARFSIERSQPLVVVPVDKNAPVQHSILSVKPAGVIVTAFKPSDDGKARIVRLFNAGERPEKAGLIWAKPEPKTVWLSNLAEKEISKITGPIDIAPYEIVTLRVPRPYRKQR